MQEVAVISRAQLDVIDAFEADYNAIDQWLRKHLDQNKTTSFTSMLGAYSRAHSGWRDKDLLSTVADIRNAIVHGKVAPYGYLAVPTPEIAGQLRKSRERLTRPKVVIPTMQRAVKFVSPQDTLATVLRLVATCDYSQFPVYEKHQFRGLLTENGIARWLAHHVSSSISLVELDEVTVSELLKNEEARKNFHFVGKEFRLDHLPGLYSKYDFLEAVLITETGKETESLLGLATRWDTIDLDSLT